MRYQSNRASCGPASLHNALASLGIHRTEDELIALCKQTKDGTSSAKLVAAIKAVSTPAQPTYGETIKWRSIEEGAVGLWYIVAERGRPVILCVDNFDHWAACVGYLGGRYMVVDSAEIGLVFYYTREELGKRWEGPKGGFHGIVV